MSSKKQTAKPTLPFSIVLPILIGLTSFILLFTLINNGTISSELLKRYLAGHAVSKVTTAMFLIGFASLCLIAWDVIRQRGSLARISLADRRSKQQRLVDGEQEEPSTEQLQFRLEKFEGNDRRTYLWRRLYTSLDFVHRNGTPDGLDEEIKYASEQDQDEKHERYSLVRILVWAIPMLGFLGTVLGISEALGGIQLSKDNDLEQMMGGLRSSLYVAFDTTAVALTFAILLMFTQFAVDRTESSLLTRVDERTREELSKHWDVTNQMKDSYVQTVEAIGASMLDSTERLVDRQVDLWRTNIEAAESAWVESVRSAQETVQAKLQTALTMSTDRMTESLTDSIRSCDEAVGHRWEQWQLALSENSRMMVSHQEQMVEQTKVLMSALENIGSLAEAKKALVDYLAKIPASDEYSAATDQLATAVRLLEFRLSQIDDASDQESTGLRKAA